MTSSFNLSRRKKPQSTYWGHVQHENSVCLQGYTGYRFGNHGFKFCHLDTAPDGSSWIDGSSNKEAQALDATQNGVQGWSYTLYDYNKDPRSFRENIPVWYRNTMSHEPLAELDRYGYRSLPVRGNGTGYENVRGVDSPGKWPMYAIDNFGSALDETPVWDPHKFPASQPYLAYQNAKKAHAKGTTSLSTRYGLGDQRKSGHFYGEPQIHRERYNRGNTRHPTVDCDRTLASRR